MNLDWKDMVNNMDKLEYGVNLIASENLPFKEVLRYESSPFLISKYAEGDYLRRYYSNCGVINEIEKKCIDKLCELTGMEYANVQPYSGSVANIAVYLTVLNPGDRILSLDLGCGGHLTHGAGGSFSAKFFNVLNYGVDKESGMIDYEEMLKKTLEFKPKLIIAGSSSYSRYIDFKTIREIADKVGAYVLFDMAHYIGLILGKAYNAPSPFCYADFVTFTTHKTFKGPRGAVILCKRRFAKELDLTVFPMLQGGPFMHTIAGKLIAAEAAETKEYSNYQLQVVENAKTLCNHFIDKGLSIVSGGTDTHVFTLLTSSFNKSGRDCEEALEKAGVFVNRNLIPYDNKAADEGSGIRIGTPFITSLGAKKDDMIIIGDIIFNILMENFPPTKNDVIQFIKSITQRNEIYW